jgi:hypothetical protein
MAKLVRRRPHKPEIRGFESSSRNEGWRRVVSLTPAGPAIADHADPGVLAVAGLDAALLKLIAGFVR